MSQPHTLSRQYTYPTCTLEIWARPSPLSHWAGRPLLKQMQFQLSLPHPEQPETGSVVLRGDRQQFDALMAAVGSYVQTFLSQSALLTATTQALHHEETEETERQPEAWSSASASGQSMQTSLKELEQAGIHLLPDTLISHRLILGSLATAESGSVLHLSTLQLFDLTTVLDEAAVEMMTLPAFERLSWVQTPPAWLRTAALVLITVGITTAVVKTTDQLSSPVQNATAPTVNQAEDRVQTEQTRTQPGRNTERQEVDNDNQTETRPRESSDSVAQSSEESPPAVNPNPSLPAPEALDFLPPPPPVGSTSPPQPESASELEAAPQPEAPAGSESRRFQSEESTALELPSLRPNAPTQSESTGKTAIPGPPIPQVTEVENYFQQRWQPPASLAQPLEYNLLLNANGSIQQITPVGPDAGLYLDRTGMPLMGESFVSPLRDQNSARVRVVLSPDGSVQAYQVSGG